MAAGTISSPPERWRTGRVKSIDVAPHRPSAVERLRREFTTAQFLLGQHRASGLIGNAALLDAG